MSTIFINIRGILLFFVLIEKDPGLEKLLTFRPNDSEIRPPCAIIISRASKFAGFVKVPIIVAVNTLVEKIFQ
jgi:hypothetical protein